MAVNSLLCTYVDGYHSSFLIYAENVAMHKYKLQLHNISDSFILDIFRSFLHVHNWPRDKIRVTNINVCSQVLYDTFKNILLIIQHCILDIFFFNQDFADMFVTRDSICYMWVELTKSWAIHSHKSFTLKLYEQNWRTGLSMIINKVLCPPKSFTLKFYVVHI